MERKGFRMSEDSSQTALGNRKEKEEKTMKWTSNYRYLTLGLALAGALTFAPQVALARGHFAQPPKQSSGNQRTHDVASKVGTGTTVVGALTQVGQSDVFRRDLLKAIEDYHRRGWGKGKSVEAYFPYAQKVQKASKVVGGVTTVVGVGAGAVRMATATNPEDRVLGGLNAAASAIPGPYGKAASIGVTAGEMIGNIDTGLSDPLNRQRSMNVRGVIAEGIRSTYIQPKSGSVLKEYFAGWRNLFGRP